MEELEQPPVFKKWSHWYWLVMVVLLVQIIAYFLLTKYFA